MEENIIVTPQQRTAKINLGGKEYEMLLTTEAVMQITEHFGGVDKVGEKLANSKDLSEQVKDVLWLLTLLVNQGIRRSNLKRRLAGETFVAVKEFEEGDIGVLTDIGDLVSLKNDLIGAMMLGLNKNIESDVPEGAEDSKNAEA